MHEIEEPDLFRDFLPGIAETDVHDTLDTVTVEVTAEAQIVEPPVSAAETGDSAEQVAVLDVEEIEIQAVQVQPEAPGQLAFIELTEWWEPEWQDMPEYTKVDMKPWRTLFVHFEERQDMLDFAELIGQRISLNHRQPSVWYPPHAIKSMKHRRFVDEVPE